MTMKFKHHVGVAVDRAGVIGRRDFVRGLSLASAAAGGLSWTDRLSLHAAELRRRQMSCILLWMPGGPSQFETFDPKPGHESGGETEAISTSIPGVQFADNLPQLAKAANRLAVVRSMSTKEGNHQRASYLLHTSYVPLASLRHPSVGSVIAQQLADAACELPSFVRIGNGFANTSNGGFLGSEFDAFAVQSAGRMPDNGQPTGSTERFQQRLALLDRMEQAAPGDAGAQQDHAKLYAHASRMIQSSQMQAFDLSREPDSIREAYGKTSFGNACLLARRLVESGVTCVEASLPGWDTHFDNFSKTRSLCGQLDQPFAYLLKDLDERGMLERTLVVWMGEFGRSPRINPRAGRDHFPRAFSVVLAGGGIRGGQVLGGTDRGGEEVTGPAIGEKDLFQTIYKSLGIDASQEMMSPVGRPIKIVDGGRPVAELFG
ncbi:MAG TPA: DUF1501 domain-containing protein [Pirellulales bacterium]